MSGVQRAAKPTTVVDVTIPYTPRRWARPFHASFRRWIALLLHRRAGKTTAVLNHHQRACLDDDWELKRLRHLSGLSDAELKPMLRQRMYGHVLPTYKQAKLTAWEMLKYYADPVKGIKRNEAELYVRYPGGHIIRLFGADDPDALRGPAFSGLSFDEYGLHPRNLFGEVLSKSLADHLGYAVFDGTIKGKDQLFLTHEAGKNDPTWLTVWRNVDQSLATESGTVIKFLEQAMADDRALILKGLMTQAEYDQEWFLSTDAAIKGAWYVTQMAEARKAGRICRVPYDPALPVDTDWDLGMDDLMSIWFSQSLRSGEVRLIDYYEHSDVGLPHYATILREKGYVYGEHWAPNDIKVRELGTGKSRWETAKALGITFQVVPRHEVKDGIDAVRLLLPRCWFDGERCAVGLEALRNYRKRWNEQLRQFSGAPLHDFASHGSDAFRGLAMRHKVPEEARKSSADDWRPTPLGSPEGWMR